MSRIAAALNTDDLAHHEQPCDSDTVRALGLTAIHRSLGVLIMEAKEACAGDSPHDAARIRDLIGAVRHVIQKQARRDKLVINSMAVASHVVRELVMDRCPRCQGRGFLPMSFGPEAEDGRGVTCPDCQGSGRARLDHRARARVAGHDSYSIVLKRFYEAVEKRLAEAEWTAWDKYYSRFSMRYWCVAKKGTK